MVSLNLNKIVKGLGSGFIGNIINILQKIILIPLFIKYLGQENYAAWVVLVTIVSYFSLLDLGCGQAIISNLQRNIDNKFRVAKELSQYIYFFFFFPIFFFLATFLIFFFNKDILEYFFSLDNNYNTIFFILLLNSAISILFSILVNFYSAIDLFYKANLISNLYLILQTVSTIVLLYLGFGIFEISLSYLLLIFIFILVLFKKISYYLKINLLYINKFNFIIIKKILKKSINYFIINFSNSLTTQGIVLIISNLFNSFNLIVYTSVKTLTYFSRQVNSLFFNSIWFSLSKNYNDKTSDNFFKLYLFFFRCSNLFSLFMALVLLHLAQIIINKWIGEQYVFSKFFLSLLIILMLTQSLIYSLTSYFQALNKIHVITKQLFIFSILNIFSFYFAAKIFGLENGFITSILLDFFFIILLSKKIFDNEKKLIRQIIVDMSIISIFSLLILDNYGFEFICFVIYSILTLQFFYKNATK